MFAGNAHTFMIRYSLVTVAIKNRAMIAFIARIMEKKQNIIALIASNKRKKGTQVRKEPGFLSISISEGLKRLKSNLLF